eukprot:TRINITY_DN4347_c0_g1_i1.p1 TRINITY_DN4347_c0_g1~~TRINITY_DN4347_c0_g1_i1.p1  ORF type:complete len:496 (-),score=74.04 TRINITY_DN4347_c0_g1_i1:222-1688(-)
MSVFSSGLQISGIDDFMGPSQECIKPVQVPKTPASVSGGIMRIEVDDGGHYFELGADGSKAALEPTKITLSDCLACSGCVTTAESVLIEAQGVTEFFRHVNDEEALVVTISPQSLASLAAHYSLSLADTLGKLATFFQSLPTATTPLILDAAFSRELSLLESAREFVEWRLASSSPTGPLLTSACPGWVCYAEKTHGEAVLPFMSTTKSPQQIMGALLRRYCKPDASKPIYHVAIMPCYDKKLEASREDFYDDLLKTRDVDCVLATSELQQMLVDRKVDFASLPLSPLPASPLLGDGPLMPHPGGTSGGYLEYVFRYAAQELYGVQVQEIEYHQVRNSDFQEIVLKVDGKVVLKFARANGFRNIQNIMRAIKRKRKNYYDYIEVMACPGGCTNGGGQIKPEALSDPKQLLARVNAAYDTLNPPTSGVSPSDSSTPSSLPASSPSAPLTLYHQLFKGSKEKDEARHRDLHTSFHAVPKLELKEPRSILW